MDMATNDPEFEQMSRGILDGNQEVIEQAVKRYRRHLLRVARYFLNRTPRLRSLFDSDDFVQEVWASLSAKLNQANELVQDEDLVAFLAQLARNKVVDAQRKHLDAGNRDLRRKHSLDDLTPKEAQNLIDGAPAPLAVAAAREEWARLLREQPVHYRRMLLLLVKGHTQQEVAEQLGVTDRTVRYVLELVKRKRGPEDP
jgi:RNA polymerase sigma factor (sigma-70 family)